MTKTALVTGGARGIGRACALALVAALPTGFLGFPSPIPRNVVVIALTGISTVCVGILTQLGLAELAKARNRPY
jgi:hypothetical protein